MESRSRMSTSNPQALLKGSIVRAIMLLAGPMFISAFLQNAQSLIDLFWVGRLGSESVAALALSGAALMVLFPIQMGLATGTVALVSRAYGAGDARRASFLSAQSLTFAIGVGLLLGLLFLPFVDPACRLLGAEPAVAVLAGSYLRVSLYGLFAGLVLFIVNSALQGAGNTVVPMGAMLLANILNLILDPLLIYGIGWFPRLGVAGAAWATVLSHVLAAAALLTIMASGRTHLRPRWADYRPVWMDGYRLLRIGLPSMGQMASRSLMGMVFFRIIARYGTAVVAGYGIGMRWHMVLLMPCFVLANAAATLVGQNLGAGQPERAQRAAWACAGLVGVIMVTLIAVIFGFAEVSIRLFDASPAVVDIGSGFLRTVSPFYLLAGISIVLDRALNGAGCTLSTMIFTVVTLWGLQVPLALLFANWFDPPVQGVWWAMNTATTLHVILSVCWFLTGRWKRQTV